MKPAHLIALFATVLSTTLTALGPSTSHALSNPLMRVCRTEGGQFEVEPLGSDDIALCRWGQTLIDSQTLLSKLSGGMSNAADIIVQDQSATSCSGASAVDHVLASGETLCIFGDGSALALHVMRAGLSDSGRLHLKDILTRR